MSRNVVITGVGCVGPFGLGRQALAQALAAGVPCASEVERTTGYHRAHAARLAGRCAGLDFAPWLSPQAARRMSDLSQYTVTACRMAMQDAGLADVRGDGTAIVVATAHGPGGFTEQLARQILEKGGKAASPFLFTDCVANAAAGQAGIDLGARGPNVTICQREAGPLLALAQGADEIARGRADLCFAGAADEIDPLVHAILDRFRAIARPTADGELPRPFDRRRNGALASAGATMLLLEAEDRARARGATILARVGRTVRAFDPTASRAGFGRDPQGLAEALRDGFGDALDAVDVIVSGAAGTRAGDALEAAVLHAAMPRLPAVVAPKAVHGEYGGGTLGAGVLAVLGAPFAVPPACGEPDPALRIRLAPRAEPARTALLSAHAGGGCAAWTLLHAP